MSPLNHVCILWTCLNIAQRPLPNRQRYLDSFNRYKASQGKCLLHRHIRKLRTLQCGVVSAILSFCECLCIKQPASAIASQPVANAYIAFSYSGLSFLGGGVRIFYKARPRRSPPNFRVVSASLSIYAWPEPFFLSVVWLRLRAFGAQPPSQLTHARMVNDKKDIMEGVRGSQWHLWNK